MKSLIIAIVILSVMIIGFTANYLYMDNVVKDMSYSLDMLESSVKENNWKNATAKFKETEKSWGDVSTFMLMLSNHTDSNKICECMVKIREYISFEDEKEAMCEIKFCKMLVEDILLKEQPKLINIF